MVTRVTPHLRCSLHSYNTWSFKGRNVMSRRLQYSEKITRTPGDQEDGSALLPVHCP